METRHPIRDATNEGRRAGFSIVELLVVMSIVAILASIAVPRFTSATENSQDATAKSDVRNALSAQEVYFVEHGEYAAFDLEAGGSIDDPEFNASPGVSVTATTEGSAVRIVGSHEASPSTWCLSTSSGAIVEGDDC